MEYYSNSTGGFAEFYFQRRPYRHGEAPLDVSNKLAEATGTQMGLDSATGYPSYGAWTVRGITEIIEHRRMEPIFYITDDPEVRAKVLSKLGAGALP